MNAKLDFQTPPHSPASDTEPTSDTEEVAAIMPVTGRRLWPLIGAAILSLSWLGAAGFAGWRAGLFDKSQGLALVDMAALVAGILAPVAIFWLIALVFQRTDPLLERRLAVAQGMNRALAPIEHAEHRLDQLLNRIRRDMDHIEAAVDLAASRIDSLEERFKSEIADLFSATADAEAKSTSIRNILGNEREALTAINDAIGDRLDAAEAAALSFSEKLELASVSAESTMSDIGARLDSHTATLSESTSQAASELTAADHVLADRLQALDTLSTDLKGRLSGITDKIDEKLDSLKTKMSELDTLDSQLSERLEDRHGRLAYLAETSETDAHRIADALIKNSDYLMEKADDALGRSESASQAIAHQVSEIDVLISGTIEKARTQFKMLSETLSDQAHEAQTITRKQADDLMERVKSAISGFDEQLSAFDERARQAGDRIAEHIGSLKGDFDHEASAVEDRASRSVEELGRLATMLADHAEIIASAAGEAARNMGEAGERMDERTTNLGQVLEDMRRRIDEVSNRLEAERGALAATSEASANTVLDAAERFRTQTDALGKHADDATSRMRENTELLGAEISRIDEQGRETAQGLDESVRRLKAEGAGLMDTLEKSSQSLGQAATAFGGERERILADTAAAAERLQEAADRVGTQAEQLRQAGDGTGRHLDGIAGRFATAAEKIIEVASKAESNTGQSIEAFEETLSSAITKGLHDVGQSMDTLNTMFSAEVSDLEKRVTKSIDETVNVLRRAASEAGTESERMAARLSEQSDRLVNRANSFLSKSEEIERRILASSKDEFVRTSSLLIESLQSASVDIDKILALEVPDDVWQRYLSGDRSIFSRRTVRLADNKSRKRITEMFETDREFRDTVLKFFRDFESLMEQVAGRDKHSALSVSLISSDMGKLYVLLAQSLKKIQ